MTSPPARSLRPRRPLARLARALGEAVLTGRSGPAHPRPRWLSPRVPGFLGLLPFRTVDLVPIADLVLAFVLFRAVQSMNAGGAELSALTAALPLVLRNRWPLAAWRLAAVLAPLDAVTREQSTDLIYSADVVIMYLLVVYAVAVRCERHITIGVWIISIAGLWIIDLSLEAVGTLFLGGTMVTVAVLLGYNIQARRTAAGRLAEEERRSERALAGQAVLEERARIARELHDVVAHHMSVIAIQAEAVPLKAKGEVRLLEEGLAEIRTLSLAAMTEMRRVLGVLRDADGARDTGPQPGLGRLEELVATARSAGLTVTLSLGGDLLELPTAVSLSAYRIVQESLSNAMRHAPGSTVSIKIGRSGDELNIHVASSAGTRPAAEPATAGRPGHGLIGMRERVSMLGGSLWTGPVGTGFAVTAILPITQDDSAATA
ncbi:sensor histidine kinase [Planomonospora venezuelensis]|uniref:histidine kinase n=1 Tax=Planomonospora venezuelensis TaxID=1999 RepID=A0A841D5C0_PLAVE|nr:histidine kinase [Planomonospora venezuelensis]MBB5964153.1 signal transduction histidine kinase [Planomonospora venezuelensis]GIN01837.1 two-component sensor histidine kinase [Planomonospora venezuelensis]